MYVCLQSGENQGRSKATLDFKVWAIIISLKWIGLNDERHGQRGSGTEESRGLVIEWKEIYFYFEKMFYLKINVDFAYLKTTLPAND